MDRLINFLIEAAGGTSKVFSLAFEKHEFCFIEFLILLVGKSTAIAQLHRLKREVETQEQKDFINCFIKTNLNGGGNGLD